MELVPGVEATLTLSHFDGLNRTETVQICVRLYTLIALSKQEPAPLTKPVSDHRDQRYGRFCGPTPHVRYPTFGTNGYICIYINIYCKKER